MTFPSWSSTILILAIPKANNDNINAQENQRTISELEKAGFINRGGKGSHRILSIRFKINYLRTGGLPLNSQRDKNEVLAAVADSYTSAQPIDSMSFDLIANLLSEMLRINRATCT